MCARLSSSVCRATESLRASGLELAVKACEDLDVWSREFVDRRAVTERAMEPDFVVMIHDGIHNATSLFAIAGSFVAEAFILEGVGPTFEFAVALRLVRVRAVRVTPTRRMNCLTSLVINRGPLSAMILDFWPGCFIGLAGRSSTLGPLYRLTDRPVKENPAVAVERRVEEVKGAGRVQVGYVDLPVGRSSWGLRACTNTSLFFGK